MNGCTGGSGQGKPRSLAGKWGPLVDRWRLLAGKRRSLAARTLRRGLLLLDAILLRVYKVEVFADDPECILRWSRGRLERAVTLPDGSRLRPGDIVIELHFWNEHLPQIADNGADFLWGKEFARRLVHSLRLLAVQALGDPRFADFAALHAEAGFIPAADVESLHGLAWRFGFLLEIQEVAGRRVWKKAFWAGLYSWWLMWAFNPGTLKRKKLVDMARSHLWMTRATLLARYSEEGGTAEVDAVACHARQERIVLRGAGEGLPAMLRE